MDLDIASPMTDVFQADIIVAMFQNEGWDRRIFLHWHVVGLAFLHLSQAGLIVVSKKRMGLGDRLQLPKGQG